MVMVTKIQGPQASKGDNERAPAAAAVVAAFARSAEHSWLWQVVGAELIADLVPLAGGRVPDDVAAEGAVVVEDGAAVAEGRGGDEAGKLGVPRAVEEAEHGGRWVQRAVAAVEGGVGDDAAPGLVDRGGPDEPRRVVRRQAEEDARDEIVRERLRRRRRHSIP